MAKIDVFTQVIARGCGDMAHKAAAERDWQTMRVVGDILLRFAEEMDDEPVGLPIMLWSGIGGRIINADAASCRLLGYTRGDLTQMTHHDLCHPDEHEPLAASFAQLRDAGFPRLDTVRRYRHGLTGEWIWLRTSSVMVFTDDAEMAFFVVQIDEIVIDVPSQHLSMERLPPGMTNIEQALRRLAGLPDRADQESQRPISLRPEPAHP